MDFLFTFKDHIDTVDIFDFEQFCWELAEILCFVRSANDNEEGIVWPPNYVFVYVDTENEEHLEIISNKYNEMIAKSDSVDKPADFIHRNN